MAKPDSLYDHALRLLQDDSQRTESGCRVWSRKSDRRIACQIRGRLGGVKAEMRHVDKGETFPKLSPYMQVALWMPDTLEPY